MGILQGVVGACWYRVSGLLSSRLPGVEEVPSINLLSFTVFAKFPQILWRKCALGGYFLHALNLSSAKT